QRIDAIIDKSSQEIQSIHAKHLKAIGQSISNRNAQITGLLNPDQQQLFDKFEKERRESRRGKEGRWPGKPPPQWNKGKDKDRDKDGHPAKGPRGDNREKRQETPTNLNPS